MKKIIVSSIIICLLLSSIPLSVSGQKASSNPNVNANLDVSMKSIVLPKKNDLPLKIPKSEYAPGEIIVKFKDNSAINFHTSSVSVPYYSETSQIYNTQTMATFGATGSQQINTVGDGQPIGYKNVLVTGSQSLDTLSFNYGLIDTEKLIEDGSVPEFSNVYRLVFNKDINVLGAVENYSSDSSVEFAEPNYNYHFDNYNPGTLNPDRPGFIPNDPYFGMQWDLYNTGQNGGTPGADIHAPKAWDTTMGSSNVVVAILDSGVDYTNPELGGCNKGITELDYSIESTHPWPKDSTTILSFSEIFSQYDFDSISLHFSKIDNSVRVRSSTTIFDLFDTKDMLYLPAYKGITTDIWTRYTEMGNKKVYIESNTGNTGGSWGWAIDKVRLSKYIPLSSQSDKFVDGYDFYSYDPDPMDDVGHGTHCAGIVAALTNNSIGVAGVAGNCKIMPIRVGGQICTFAFTVARGLIFAANHGANVISMSFSGPESTLEEKALDYAYKKGCVLISSAGNYNCTAPEFFFPASYDKVIGVSATDRNDAKTDFSCYGSYVDVAAPGYDILSLRAFATDLYFDAGAGNPGEHFIPQYDKNAILYRATGTSMAGPIVAGVAALILSKNPNLTPQEVRTILRSSTDPVISDKYIGTGRINAYKAIQKAAPVTAEFDKTMNDAIAAGNFEIKGTTSKEGAYPFEYFIEYGEGMYPSTWTVIKHSTSPTDGALYTWNTLQVNDGPYVLRLRVIFNGFTYEDRAFITIDNIANTYYVANAINNGDGSQNNPFNKIQYAVDICSNKDTIFVYNGVYNDLITQGTGRSAKIVGENKDETIIQEFISITYGGLSIEKCTIKNQGIAGYPTFNCNISDDKFIDIYGIDLTNPGKSYLKINIRRNNFINGGYLYLFKCSDCKISENTEVGSINLESCKRITISGNQIYGIYTLFSNNNNIMDNTISGGQEGISVLGGRSNLICNNDISNMKYFGITLNKFLDMCSCSNNVIKNNTISNSGYAGIYLGDPDNSHVHDLGNFPIPSCSYNEIKNNEIKNSNYGIYIFGSSQNTVAENILSYNSIYGVYIQNSAYFIGGETWHKYYSKNNKIYLNNFIENGNSQNEGTGNAYDEGNNTWYEPILHNGNYWSDYSLKYPGAYVIHRLLRPDIWNMPYSIDGGTNKDMYPLVNQHSNSNSDPQINPSPQTQPSTQPSAQPSSQSQPQVNPSSPSPSQQSTKPSSRPIGTTTQQTITSSSTATSSQQSSITTTQQSVTSATTNPTSTSATMATTVTSTATTSKSTSLPTSR